MNWDRIIKSAPLFGGLFIFMAMLQLTIYYSSFRININHFLEFSEIITVFLDRLVLLIIISFIAFIALGMYTPIKKVKVKSIREAKEPSIKTVKARKRNLFLKKVFVLIFPGAFFLLLVLSYMNSGSATRSLLFVNVYFVCMLIVLRLSYWFRISIQLRHGKMISEFTYQTIVFTMLFFMMMTLTTLLSVESLKRLKVNIGTEFVVDDERIISDSTNYYIGKTNKFLFYYMQDEDRTIVYPMSRIKELSFGKARITTK